MGEKIGFLEELRRALDEHGLRRRRIAVAVSGGADSTALLRGLVELSEPFRLELLAVHVDHGLRGEQSRADAEWTATLCQRVQVPFEYRTVNVFERAEKEKIGLEEAARSARYEVLEQVAAARHCSHLAVAHTADDQAETVLHHILRGTGVSGLRGMRPARRLRSGVWLVRPLLRISRRQVEQFLNDVGRARVPYRSEQPGLGHDP
ncbi:MAG: tRNA lysidine(34) synthetase TilS [Planctomycetes bacterium]|nr:tRNA lysidine(34) synthetase TilS [Planctomycetota bacterium]